MCYLHNRTGPTTTTSMSPIKDFKLIYEALNQEGTFSAGDTVVGTVNFKLSDETKVKHISVKVKGEARVHWTEGTGDHRRSHSDHRTYFKEKVYLVEKRDKKTELPKGDHCFNFNLRIPQGDFPSSFKGFHGRIVYTLEAKISRSWRMPTVEQKELQFVSKSSTIPRPIMYPNSGSVDEEVGTFSKGQVQFSATVNKEAYSPGEILSIVGTVCNSSSKETTAKFSLQKRVVFTAHASHNTSDQSLCKMVGNTIKENSKEPISCQMKIPDDVTPTLRNCEIISVEYYLKVYLDISFAIDPEVKLPLVIIPSGLFSLQSGEAVGPYPAGAVGGPSYSDFPPPAFPGGPYPAPAAPGAYGYPAPNPAQLPYTSGFNNQWPQQVPPYGFSSAAYPPAWGQQQAPTAPPLFQQGGQVETTELKNAEYK